MPKKSGKLHKLNELTEIYAHITPLVGQSLLQFFLKPVILKQKILINQHTRELGKKHKYIFASDNAQRKISSKKEIKNPLGKGKAYIIKCQYVKKSATKKPATKKSAKLRASQKIRTLQKIRTHRKIYKHKTMPIFLVIEKSWQNNHLAARNSIGWNNYDSITIVIHPDEKNAQSVRQIESAIHEFKTIKGGYSLDSRITNMCPALNDVQYPTHFSLNKNIFYKLLNNISEYYISGGYIGTDYVVVIYDNIMYDIRGVITTKPTKIQGFNVFATVKNKDAHVIRYVAVSNGKSLNYQTHVSINNCNKKFGDLLGWKYMTYYSLSNNNYRKCIKLHQKRIDNKEIDYIEISDKKSYNAGNFLKNYNNYRWSSKTPTITFYCRECPAEYYDEIKHVQSANDGKIPYLLFLTGSVAMLFDTIPYNNPKLKKLHRELFGENFDTLSVPVFASMSVFPDSYVFMSDIPDLNKQHITLTADKYPHMKFIEKTHASSAANGVWGDPFKHVEINTWDTYTNPITVADMVLDKDKIPNQMYFMNKRKPMHVAPIKYNNFVKSALVQRAKNQQNVIDLATGRGSDLFSYKINNVKNVLFVEIDRDAISELLSRKYSIRDIPMAKTQSMTISIINSDLNKPSQKLLNYIKNDYHRFSRGVSLIYCFFALHYMCGNLANIKNITKLISALLSKRGRFIYTSFDETAVVKLLSRGKWTVMQGGQKKYEIIPLYKPTDKHKRIKLILPFNVSTHFYEEELINDKMLDAEFAKHRIKVVEENNFLTHMNRFKTKKNRFFRSLTNDDKTFIGLYKYKIYEKY